MSVIAAGAAAHAADDADDAADDPDALPLGRVVQGTVGGILPGLGLGRTPTYRLCVEAPGMLTLVLRAEEAGRDLSLVVKGPGGDVVAVTDRDVDGDVGAEQVLLELGRPGDYKVTVEAVGLGRTTYRLGATFLPFDGLRRTAAALADVRELAVGEPLNLHVAPGRAEYFSYVPENDGVLTVVTRGVAGDVKLAAWAGRRDDINPDTPHVEVDHDVGHPASETLSIHAPAGTPVLIRVEALSWDGESALTLVAFFNPLVPGADQGDM